jgi:hypothetical protein
MKFVQCTKFARERVGVRFRVAPQKFYAAARVLIDHAPEEADAAPANGTTEEERTSTCINARRPEEGRAWCGGDGGMRVLTQTLHDVVGSAKIHVMTASVARISLTLIRATLATLALHLGQKPTNEIADCSKKSTREAIPD